MLNKLILIENGQSRQFSKEEDLIKYFLGSGYYNQSEEKKMQQMELNALAKCIGTDMKVVKIDRAEAQKEKIDLKNKFIVYDEKTYILSLLLTQRAMLLESIDSNIFTGNLDKAGITDNYIIVNTFAEKLLDKYINGQ